MHGGLFLGCVADDFTGASDAASFLSDAGVATLMCDGIPAGPIPAHIRALVIALKTRTMPVAEAVARSLRAFAFLRDQGAEQFFFKYCSTFDSRPEGNIGPVIDAAMALLGIRQTLLCPALPVNGRTVRDGHLYVGGVPLHETHMGSHPLTPMWSSDIGVLMRDQGKHRCVNLPAGVLDQSTEAVRAYLHRALPEEEAGYIVPDQFLPEHAEVIVRHFGACRLLTGGSGLMTALAHAYRARCPQKAAAPFPSGVQGRALLLAGSCSATTQSQVRHFEGRGCAAVKLDPQALAAGTQTVDRLWRGIEERQAPVLVYSTDDPQQVRKTQRNVPGASQRIERAMAQLAVLAARAGFTRLIVAGGETSGAVTKALAFDAFEIGRRVAPGVPVMRPLRHPQMRLVLKSGNFGQEDFFSRALAMTSAASKEE